MNFSAKQVINCSAAKLKWMREHPEESSVNNSRYRDLQEQGLLFQENVAKVFAREGYKEEMGGFVSTSAGDRIYFSNDIVLDNGRTIIECKLPSKEGRWEFLKKSILQCAFYSFLSDQCSLLRKARFAINLGEEDTSIRLQDNFQYLLAFGSQVFKIEVTNPLLLWTYLESKLNASRESYDIARHFDSTHPKEHLYDSLESAFNVTQIQ